MKYKVGDRVKVKSQDWYKSNMNSLDEVDCGVTWFVPDMVVHCGNNVTIREVFSNYYKIIEDECDYCWTDDMFEGLADEENILESIDNTADLLPKYVKTTRDMNTEQTELDITEEYEYVDDMGNVIDTKKIIIRKKKPKYPTTYEECCEVLGIYSNRNFVCNGLTHKASNYDLKLFSLLEAFKQLLICRDAYWKLYGEEMGLGKPWEPDWSDLTPKYTIVFIENDAKKVHAITASYILAFPIYEMREDFYENFKDLINECKELL